MMDLPQSAYLAAYRGIAARAVEELQGPLLALDFVTNPVYLRKGSLPEYVQDLKTPVYNVTNSVVSSFGPS